VVKPQHVTQVGGCW